MDYFVSFAFLAVTLLTYVVFYFKRSFQYWKNKKVPNIPPSFPLGNLDSIIFESVSFSDVFTKVYTTFKKEGHKCAGFYVFSKPILVALDVDLIKSILISDFDHFVNHAFYLNKEVDPFSAHLFSLKDADWKKLREKLSVIFTSSKMKMMFLTIDNIADGLLDVAHKISNNGESVDMKDLAGKYTADSITSCAFGVDLRSLQDEKSKFREYMIQLLGNNSIVQTFKMILITFAPDLLKLFKVRFISKEMGKYFKNMISETIEYREKNDTIRKDLLQLMIQLKNNIKVKDEENDDDSNLSVKRDNNNINEKQGLTVDEITAQALVFFGASFETSSSAITFTFLELAVHQNIQEKLRSEIRTIIKKNGLNHNSILKMSYLDCCIKEALRKYPSLSSLFRECGKTYQVPHSDIIIEKGTLVFIPSKQVQSDPEIFPNPEQFIPERFCPGSPAFEERSQHVCSFLAFGMGPRMCIGARFGMMQVKVAIVRILNEYRCTLDPRTEYPIKISPKGFTMSPVENIYIKMERV